MTGSRGLLGPFLTCALIALVGTPANATARSASITGIEWIKAVSRYDSDGAKGAQANCPIGKRVIGTGGGIVTGLSNHVIMTEVSVNAALTSVTVFGFEDEIGTTESWSAVAVAVCADPPSGLQRVTATGNYDSFPAKSLSVSCPNGKQVLGFGGLMSGAERDVMLNNLQLDMFGRPFIAALEDQTGTTANWNLSVYGICADPIGVQWVTSTSPSSSPDRQVHDAICPLGMVAIGTGGSINGGSRHVTLRGITPHVGYNGDLSRIGRAVATEDYDGLATNWSLTTQTACADQ